MKVCTDACLFGAFVADNIQHSTSNIQHILDIGSGTGLLSLMIAQKSKAEIDAVEIDEFAAQQAEENFNASPWKERLDLHHSSIQQFNFSTNRQYEVIISNPPFFEQSLKSTDDKKNNAKHTVELSFEELAYTVSDRLKDDGTFYVLLPFYEFQKFNEVAKAQQLYLLQQVNIRQTDKHSYFRTMGVFSKEQLTNTEAEEIIIKINNEYSAQFIQLLKDYYLYL